MKNFQIAILGNNIFLKNIVQKVTNVSLISNDLNRGQTDFKLKLPFNHFIDLANNTIERR